MQNVALPLAPAPEWDSDYRSGPLADLLNRMTDDEFFAFCQTNSHLNFERRADGSVSVINSFDETLSGEDVLPGFGLPLAALR